MRFDKLNKLRRVYACHTIVSVKLHAGHLAEMVNVLAVLAATERNVVSFRRFKRFDPFDGKFNLVADLAVSCELCLP